MARDSRAGAEHRHEVGMGEGGTVGEGGDAVVDRGEIGDEVFRSMPTQERPVALLTSDPWIDKLPV